MNYNQLQPKEKAAITRLLTLQREYEEVSAQLKSVKSDVLGLMARAGVDKIDKNRQSITRVGASQSVRVDGAKLKELYADVYNECSKIVNTAEHLRVHL